MSATVLQFPTPAPKDGGKARILRRLDGLFGRLPLEECLIMCRNAESLTMDHADTEHFGGPIFIPPRLHDMAAAEGFDMRAYVKQQLIPIDIA